MYGIVQFSFQQGLARIGERARLNTYSMLTTLQDQRPIPQKAGSFPGGTRRFAHAGTLPSLRLG